MDWWALFRTVAVVHVIATTEHSNAQMHSQSRNNPTALFMDIVGVSKSCGLVPPPDEWQKPICKEKLGCNIPLNCFNYSTLTRDNRTLRTQVVTPVNLELILESPLVINTCAVVLFYAPWCPYSVEFSPQFNALGRSFRELQVLAIDFSANDPYKYLTAYLPLVNFYHKGKVIYRFKATESYEELLEQISVMTGFQPIRVDLSDVENEYPVPTVRMDGDVMYLQVATAWVLLICIVYICTTRPVVGCINTLAVKLKRTKK